MSVRSFFKQSAMNFFIITTCVTLATAIIGPAFMPGMTFGFNAFYSPLIAGVLGTLPAGILFSRKELNLKRTIIRRALHLAALEAILTVFGWINKNFADIYGALLFMLMVFIIYLAVNVISFSLDNRDAKRINEGLKALQNRK